MDKNLPQINFRADDCDGQANKSVDDTTKFENLNTHRRKYKIEIKTKLAKDNTQAAAHTVDASNAKIRRHDAASWSAM
jgi:hypothetical protein